MPLPLPLPTLAAAADGASHPGPLAGGLVCWLAPA